jgi:hypothetical protein
MTCAGLVVKPPEEPSPSCQQNAFRNKINWASI